MLGKKIKEALALANITTVISGYYTQVPSDALPEQMLGIKHTAFTGWNKDGKVVCVLIKKRKDVWRPQ